MNKGYQDPGQVKNYSDFLETEDGKFQKQIILDAVFSILKAPTSPLNILDIGCGPGWLSNELALKGHAITGCDVSQIQIDLAKKNYPNLNFVLADPQVTLPFTNASFDVIITALSLCDMRNQPAALKEIRRALKNGGKFINIIPNPYYAYPVGIWKRGILGKIFGKMPALKLLDYFSAPRDFVWKNNLPSRFYPLAEQINNIIAAGFKITKFAELRSESDDEKFSRKYQLYRFPLYLVLKCT